MADISPQGIPDFGNLLTSYSRNQAAANLTNQEAGLAGAQTGLAQVNTQKASLEVSMIKQAMETMQNISPASAEQSGAEEVDPTTTGVASSLNKKMYVDPMGPPGIQQYINATAWVNPQEAQRAEEMRKMMVASQTSKNQNEANDIFQTASALKDAPNSLQSLLNLKPGTYLNNVGRAISSMQGKSDDEKEQMAENAIGAATKYSHQYTGRELTTAGDEYRDKTSGAPVYAPKIGPTAGEQIDIGKWANTPQKVTIDNREATVKPKDLGITSYQDLAGNRSIRFSNPPPGAPRAPSPAPQPTSPAVPGAQQASGTQTSTPNRVGGFSQDQGDFVSSQPPAFPNIKGNQALNADDLKQRSIYRDQRDKLADKTNQSTAQVQNTLTNVQRINTLMSQPLTLGPGSREYSQLRTTLNQWFGVPAGEAPAYQILSKMLNADQMNSILKEFHGEGAQVRLGAYESRLIMEQLAANPQMTKEAITQMLKWQSSDAQYEGNKAKVAGAVISSNRSVENFDKNYGNRFPKTEAVDTSLSSFKRPAPPAFENEVKQYMQTNSHPERIKDFQDHYGYLPMSRVSAPTRQELDPKWRPN